MLTLVDLARDRRLTHAQGADDFRLAGNAFLGRIGVVLGLDRLVQAGTGVPLVQPGQREKDHSADEGQHPDQRMEQEAAGQVDRCPRRIEQGQHPLAADGPAHIVELAQGMGVGGLALQIHDPRQDLARQHPVQTKSGAQHQSTAQPVQPGQGGQGEQGHHRDQDQRRQTTGRHDPVIDLHHIEGRCQIQQVDQGGEHRRPDEMGPARLQRLGQGLRARFTGKQVLEHEGGHSPCD